MTLSAICNEEVPFINPTEYLAPVYFAIFFSNKLTKFPEPESQLDLIYSLRYFFHYLKYMALI